MDPTAVAVLTPGLAPCRDDRRKDLALPVAHAKKPLPPPPLGEPHQVPDIHVGVSEVDEQAPGQGLLPPRRLLHRRKTARKTSTARATVHRISVTSALLVLGQK